MATTPKKGTSNKKAPANKKSSNPLTPSKNQAGWMQSVIDRNKKMKASDKFIWTVKSDPSKNPANNFLKDAKKVTDAKKKEAGKKYEGLNKLVKPVIDAQKKIKAGPQKVPFSVKSDPSKSPMNQSNNPLTPKPQREVLEKAKKAKALKDAQDKKKVANSKKKTDKKPMAIDGAKQAMALRDAEKRKKDAPKVKSTIESLYRPGQTPKPKTKPETPVKNSAPSVSELWKQKTGTSWSEAKSLGLTDGSASSNIALMKKLQSGSVNKNSIKSDKAASNMEPFKKDMAQNVQDELSGKVTYAPPTEPSKSGADKAADENKMRRGGMVRRRMNNGGVTKGSIPTATKGRIPTATKAPMPTATKGYKTGGMVNSNSKVSAIKSAGSRGVKTGANTRVSASKIARGRVGGTSTAPRTASPKAKMGMSVRRRR